MRGVGGIVQVQEVGRGFGLDEEEEMGVREEEELMRVISNRLVNSKQKRERMRLRGRKIWVGCEGCDEMEELQKISELYGSRIQKLRISYRFVRMTGFKDKENR